MFFQDITNSGAIPTLDAMLSFTQAQHRVLAENIANVDTPGYQTKHLDPKQFQKALAEAVNRKQVERTPELSIEGNQQFEQDWDGSFKFTPTNDPADNVLFHDQTNARIERQMSLLAENGMMHQSMAELLTVQYHDLLQAIRGTGQ